MNGELEEDIYMEPPECFPNYKDDGKVLKLKKAIYGLKQSSRAWYRKVDDCLVALDYNRSEINNLVVRLVFSHNSHL